jgi:hypothetical protein
MVEQVHGVRHVNFCGVGEPSMYPDFSEMLKFFRKKHRGKASISFSTNGVLLNRRNTQRLADLKVDKLLISIDGAACARALLDCIVCINFWLPSKHACVLLTLLRTRSDISKPSVIEQIHVNSLNLATR